MAEGVAGAKCEGSHTAAKGNLERVIDGIGGGFDAGDAAKTLEFAEVVVGALVAGDKQILEDVWVGDGDRSGALGARDYGGSWQTILGIQRICGVIEKRKIVAITGRMDGVYPFVGDRTQFVDDIGILTCWHWHELVQIELARQMGAFASHIRNGQKYIARK